MIGISVSPTIGIGDAIQFTSLPENYYRATGQKLIDTEGHWVFDYNPYVVRQKEIPPIIHNMWHLHCYGMTVEFNGRTTYLSNAESHARHLGVPVVVNRPRLYRFEDFSFYDRDYIVLHTRGVSHGNLPRHIIEHVIEKYGKYKVLLVGNTTDNDYGLQLAYTPNLWALAKVISQARMFIGPDSGPSWIAQCYPDVITKKVRLIPDLERLKNWVPLECCRISSHWDDRSAMIYNQSEDDVGFTYSYKKI